MPQTAKQKRLDNVELQLTPKQWAIGLADEVRQYASGTDFFKGVAKRSYEEMADDQAVFRSYGTS